MNRISRRVDHVSQVIGHGSLTLEDAMLYLNVKSKTTAMNYLSNVLSFGKGSGKRWDILSFADKYEKELGQ